MRFNCIIVPDFVGIWRGEGEGDGGVPGVPVLEIEEDVNVEKEKRLLCLVIWA